MQSMFEEYKYTILYHVGFYDLPVNQKQAFSVAMVATKLNSTYFQIISSIV